MFPLKYSSFIVSHRQQYFNKITTYYYNYYWKKKHMETVDIFFRNNLLPVGKRELVAVFNKNLNKTIALLTHT